MNTTETIGEYSKFIAYLKFINGTDDKENYYSVPWRGKIEDFTLTSTTKSASSAATTFVLISAIKEIHSNRFSRLKIWHRLIKG